MVEGKALGILFLTAILLLGTGLVVFINSFFNYTHTAIIVLSMFSIVIGAFLLMIFNQDAP